MGSIMSIMSPTRRRPAAALLTAITLCAWTAATPARDGHEVTVFSGYRLGGHLKDDASGETLKLGEAGSYGVIVDVPYNADGQLEVLWSHSGETLKPQALFAGAPRLAVDVDYFHVGGIHTLEGDRVKPFVVGTLGVTRMDPHRSGLDAATEFSLGLGGGAKWRLTRHLGLRFEARGYMTLLDSNGALFCGGNGCIARISGSGFGQFELSAGVFVAF